MTKLISLGLFLFIVFSTLSFNIFAQKPEKLPVKNQSSSEKKEIPVLIKHLPDWENKKDEAKIVKNSEELEKILGKRPIIKTIEFFGGAEGVVADYDEGKLLIVEYGTPQASSYIDKKIKGHLQETEETTVFYRRIGNYNVFLFDGDSETKADALFDQIKYEKVVQWLGQNPYILKQAERKFIVGTMTLFISTVIAIVSGLTFAIIMGFIVGIVFYNIRKQKRSEMPTYSDGGGLTRLNLDGLTSEITANKLLKD